MPNTPPTPKTTILDPNTPRGCPFKGMIVPGPVAGQVTHKTVPCARNLCELWHVARHACTLRQATHELQDIANHLDTLNQALEHQGRLLDVIRTHIAENKPST